MIGSLSVDLVQGLPRPGCDFNRSNQPGTDLHLHQQGVWNLVAGSGHDNRIVGRLGLDTLEAIAERQSDREGGGREGSERGGLLRRPAAVA